MKLFKAKIKARAWPALLLVLIFMYLGNCVEREKDMEVKRQRKKM